MLSMEKSKWNTIRDVERRSTGMETGAVFRSKAVGSKYFVQRLTLSHKLDFHDGCVNSLSFNESGSLLASGSDDCNVAIWDWKNQTDKPKLHYDSGHSSNVFQAKSMPNSNDTTIISCARDGQIRVGFLSLSDHDQQTKKIAQHRGPSHKLSIEPGSPHVLLSCGEDAVVFSLDLRDPKPNKLFCLHNEKNRKIPLYSIFINPSNFNEFAVGGRDQFARVFDRRKTAEEDGILKKFCPDHLKDKSSFHANITCLAYNYNGMEILASYNDEDIYLFDSTMSSEANYIHCYKGHRNSATVKGVNFFGPKSEYIVSGSDCGHVFLWDSQSEEIVHYMQGDKTGVVNVLEPHPTSCVLATSGLDHDVKIWTPTGPVTDLHGLEKQIKLNSDERESENSGMQGSPFDERILLMLFRRFRRQQNRSRERRSNQGDNNEDEDDDDDDYDDDMDSSESDSDSEDDEPANVQCAPS